MNEVIKAKVDKVKKQIKAVDTKPESLTVPQVLLKPWDIVTHSSGRHTQFVS